MNTVSTIFRKKIKRMSKPGILVTKKATIKTVQIGKSEKNSQNFQIGHRESVQTEKHFSSDSETTETSDSSDSSDSDSDSSSQEL